MEALLKHAHVETRGLIEKFQSIYYLTDGRFSHMSGYFYRAWWPIISPTNYRILRSLHLSPFLKITSPQSPPDWFLLIIQVPAQISPPGGGSSGHAFPTSLNLLTRASSRIWGARVLADYLPGLQHKLRSDSPFLSVLFNTVSPVSGTVPHKVATKYKLLNE